VCMGTSCLCNGNGGAVQTPETSCSDGHDNDCDGLTDCMDTDCTCPVTYTRSTSPQAFIDACTQTGHTTFTFSDLDDDATSLLSMPFTFLFYGVSQSQYWVGTNGIVGFDGSPVDNGDSQCLPNTMNPHPAVMIDYDDLVVQNNGVCSAVVGTAPNRKLVISWDHASNYNFNTPVADMTFSVIFAETTNTIDLIYSTMSGSPDALGSAATIGVQNAAGTGATQYDCDTTSSLSTGLAIRFTP
jgi:hypothetical protein